MKNILVMLAATNGAAITAPANQAFSIKRSMKYGSIATLSKYAHGSPALAENAAL